MNIFRCVAGSLVVVAAWLNTSLAHAQETKVHESIWIEAEHFEGLRGHCWPMGRPEMKQTDGHWGLSGPGWAEKKEGAYRLSFLI